MYGCVLERLCSKENFNINQSIAFEFRSYQASGIGFCAAMRKCQIYPSIVGVIWMQNDIHQTTLAFCVDRRHIGKRF